MLKRVALAGLAALIAGCGQNGGAGEEAAPSDATPPQASEELAPPDGTAPPAGGTQVQVVPDIPTATPGVYASGDFAARVETAALSLTDRERDGDGRLRLGMAITLANVGSEPFGVVMTEQGSPSFMLENGITLGEGSGARWSMTGLMQCGYPTDECRVRQADRYVEVAPGETVTANITLNGYFTAAQAAGLSGLTRGNLTMRLHLIQGDSIRRTLNVTMPNMPLRNDISG